MNKPMQWSHIDLWRNYHKTYGERLSGTYFFISRKKGYRKAFDSDPIERVKAFTHQLSFPLKSWGQMVRESSRRRKFNHEWNHVKFK